MEELISVKCIGVIKAMNSLDEFDGRDKQQLNLLESMELAGNVRRLFVLMEESLALREWEILMMRYGLNGKREATQNEDWSGAGNLPLLCKLD